MYMKDFDWKKLIPYGVAILAFLAFAMIYCSPLMEGKVLYAGDTMNWKGASNEARMFNRQNAEDTWWTNSMFGGMPAFQIAGDTKSAKLSAFFKRNVTKTLGEPRAILFLYGLGFFLMLICFGVNPWLSIIGAIAIALSSYFMLIIPAGHMTKAFALGALAPMIGGFYAIFRKNYWLGIPLILFFGLYAILLHPQMTYYVGLLLGVCAIAEIIAYIIAKDWIGLGLNIAILLFCVGLLYGSRYVDLKMNQDYLKETMRGGHSELTQNGEKKVSEGLDLKYATDWSYGIGETMTLLIPNWEGGASGFNLGKDSKLCQTMRQKGVSKRDAEQFCQHAPTYHGEKMFTSGPVYIGAIICFLFILGLLIVPGPYKWALLVATIFSIVLAWGRNMMWLTEFFFNYFPMYNKFRAVESILVVAEITMPLLAFLGLQQIIERKIEWIKLRNSIFIATGITAGLCLLVALFAGVFDMTSSYDEQWKAQVPQWLYNAILDQRVSMASKDAWRSLIFVLLGSCLIFWFAWQQTKKTKPLYSAIFYIVFAILVLADLVPVDKRFFNNDNFVKPKEADAYFAMQSWEEQILQDSSLYYRVLNLNANTFNDARTSYRLKSIGGYSAVKLRRYQDLIDQHISKMNWNVLDMLNTKYIITRNGVQRNANAMGNAWFVNDVQFVPTPDDECDALNTMNLRQSAVADERFRPILSCEAKPSDGDYITLTSYAPNKLDYMVYTSSDRVAVFSEIYYPDGWHLYVDGNEIQLGRANYLLRAAIIPAGTHSIHMDFVPSILSKVKWSLAFIIISLILSAILITYPLYHRYLPIKKELLN